MRQALRAGALGRPRGMGWGGRWEGGSGWGTHVNPWLIHVSVWQKPLQYCKVFSLQLITINEKKKAKQTKKEKCLRIPMRFISHLLNWLKLKKSKSQWKACNFTNLLLGSQHCLKQVKSTLLRKKE